MVDFTDSFIVCPNRKCPHRNLDSYEREGAGTRGYCIEK